MVWRTVVWTIWKKKKQYPQKSDRLTQYKPDSLRYSMRFFLNDSVWPNVSTLIIIIFGRCVQFWLLFKKLWVWTCVCVCVVSGIYAFVGTCWVILRNTIYLNVCFCDWILFRLILKCVCMGYDLTFRWFDSSNYIYMPFFMAISTVWLCLQTETQPLLFALGSWERFILFFYPLRTMLRTIYTYVIWCHLILSLAHVFDLGNGIYLLKNVDLFASISQPCCNVISTSSTFAVFLPNILRNKSKLDKTLCSLSLNMTSSNRATNEPVNAKQFHFIFVFFGSVIYKAGYTLTHARTHASKEQNK